MMASRANPSGFPLLSDSVCGRKELGRRRGLGGFVVGFHWFIGSSAEKETLSCFGKACKTVFLCMKLIPLSALKTYFITSEGRVAAAWISHPLCQCCIVSIRLCSHKQGRRFGSEAGHLFATLSWSPSESLGGLQRTPPFTSW